MHLAGFLLTTGVVVVFLVVFNRAVGSRLFVCVFNFVGELSHFLSNRDIRSLVGFLVVVVFSNLLVSSLGPVLIFCVGVGLSVGSSRGRFLLVGVWMLVSAVFLVFSRVFSILVQSSPMMLKWGVCGWYVVLVLVLKVVVLVSVGVVIVYGVVGCVIVWLSVLLSVVGCMLVVFLEFVMEVLAVSLVSILCSFVVGCVLFMWLVMVFGMVVCW